MLLTETYARLPLRIVKFVHYLPPSSSAVLAAASASAAAAPHAHPRRTVYHPLAEPGKELDYSSLEDMIKAHFPLPPPSSSASSSSSTLASPTLAKLHRHFDVQRQTITHEFFRNCEATHAGVTNFTVEQNNQVNECLRDAAEEAGFTDRVDLKRVVEMGAGTGRLVPVIASMFAELLAQHRRDWSNKKGEQEQHALFEFNEPVDKLRKSCEQAIRRTFGPKALSLEAPSTIPRIADLCSDNAESLLARRTGEILARVESNQDTPTITKEVLVMSGVAQYLTDFAVSGLLSNFSHVLLQEDICGLGELGAVFHERDASLVRSDKYFEALFEQSELKVRSQRQVVIEGCITRTWALERSS